MKAVLGISPGEPAARGGRWNLLHEVGVTHHLPQVGSYSQEKGIDSQASSHYTEQ